MRYIWRKNSVLYLFDRFNNIYVGGVENGAKEQYTRT